MKIYMLSNKTAALYFLHRENAEAVSGTATTLMHLIEIQLLDTPVES